MGTLTLAAIGVVLGSIIDAMRYARVPNDTAHVFIDQLESGFENMLFGEAQVLMLGLVDILRENVPSND